MLESFGNPRDLDLRGAMRQPQRGHEAGAYDQENVEDRERDPGDTLAGDLLSAYKAIAKYSLKPATIICAVCGCVVSKHFKRKPCRHLRELVESCKTW